MLRTKIQECTVQSWKFGITVQWLGGGAQWPQLPEKAGVQAGSVLSNFNESLWDLVKMQILI